MAQIKQFKLPDVGEGLTEGEILQWLVKPGDTVRVNQPIVEVETAKAAVELPCPYAGVVAELLYEEGATVDVGSPIISIDTDPGAAATLPENDPAAPEPRAPSAETLAEVELAGDEEPIESGLIGGPAPGGRTAVLVGYGPRTVEAKRRPRRAVTPPEAPAATEAARVATHHAFGTAAADPIRMNAVRVQEVPPMPPPELDERVSAEPAQAPFAAVRSGGGGAAALAKPPVRKYAKDRGVELGALTGTGPNGSITREDVDSAASGPAASAGTSAYAGPDTTTREQRIPVKGVRKLTAAAMVASAFTAPHVTEWITVDVTPTMKLRDRLAASREFAGVKVSPLLFVAKALLLAVRRHPMINSSWDDDAQEIVVKDYVNLGIAAATPRGLIVPNVKDAARLSLRELAEALTQLTDVARAGKTAPADMSGGTITITNVGVFGVDTGTPILNPGESAILAFGAIGARPWVRRGKVRPRQVTTLGLSFDHRIVDGELGSRFLADLAGVLSDPGTALTF